MKGKVFTAQEVQSIQNKSKVMFRGVIKPSAGLQSKWASVQNLSKCPTNYLCEVYGNLGAQFQHPLADTHQSYGYVDKMSPYGWFKCPYKVGQEIFVKEAFLYGANGEIELWNEEYYGYCKSYWRKKSAQHMKQEHSRLFLRITEIKVERLQDISEEDCLKSGVRCLSGSEIADTGDYFDSEYYFGELKERIRECGCDATIEDCDKCVYDFASPYANTYDNPFEPFIENWNATHKKPEEKWEANPFVFCYSFEVVK